jgi:hypothetical protein
MVVCSGGMPALTPTSATCARSTSHEPRTIGPLLVARRAASRDARSSHICRRALADEGTGTPTVTIGPLLSVHRAALMFLSLSVSVVISRSPMLTNRASASLGHGPGSAFMEALTRASARRCSAARSLRVCACSASRRLRLRVGFELWSALFCAIWSSACSDADGESHERPEVEFHPRATNDRASPCSSASCFLRRTFIVQRRRSAFVAYMQACSRRRRHCHWHAGAPLRAQSGYAGQSNEGREVIYKKYTVTCPHSCRSKISPP